MRVIFVYGLQVSFFFFFLNRHRRDIFFLPHKQDTQPTNTTLTIQHTNYYGQNNITKRHETRTTRHADTRPNNTTQNNIGTLQHKHTHISISSTGTRDTSFQLVRGLAQENTQTKHFLHDVNISPNGAGGQGPMPRERIVTLS